LSTLVCASVVRQSVILVASRGRRRRRWLILPPAAVPQPDYPLRGCHRRPHLATVDRSTEGVEGPLHRVDHLCQLTQHIGACAHAHR
jgi:hypothetical protein